mgnify:CR=1 FL=1
MNQNIQKLEKEIKDLTDEKTNIKFEYDWLKYNYWLLDNQQNQKNNESIENINKFMIENKSLKEMIDSLLFENNHLKETHKKELETFKRIEQENINLRQNFDIQITNHIQNYQNLSNQYILKQQELNDVSNLSDWEIRELNIWLQNLRDQLNTSNNIIESLKSEIER